MHDCNEEFLKQIKPSLRETYIILLDEKKPFVGIVSEININDEIVIINNISKKDDAFMFLLENDHLLMKSTKADYKILDIERVIPFFY